MAQCHKPRVCEPASQGDSSTWDRSGASQKLVRDRPAQVAPLGQGGRIQPPNVTDLPHTRSTLTPPLTGLTCGLQVIEGLARMGAEFRFLSEDLDTCTATSRLHLSMVLAFSEWWRNSIRERSVAGQAKVRAEARFFGRQPSLTEHSGSTSRWNGRRE